MFKTHYNYKDFTKKTDPIGGEKLVEKAGYIPAKQRIEALLYAGQRLKVARAELYDFRDGEEVDEDYFDPTRSRGFDPADATQMMNGLEANANRRIKIKQKAQAEQKEPTVQKDEKKGENTQKE